MDGDEILRHLGMALGVDQGNGFDLDSCTRDPREPARLSEENGRGLYLMRRLMDSATVTPGPQGTVVHMRRALPERVA